MAKKTAYIVKVQVGGKNKIDHDLLLKKEIITGMYFNCTKKEAQEKAIEEVKESVERGNVTLREFEITYKVVNCKGIRYDFIRAIK